MFYNVKDCGAAGDGKTKDTAAIQSAIDKAFENGGGVVVVPAGRYLCGSVVLRDNITLDLLPGAEIFASGDMDDYTASVYFPDTGKKKKTDAFIEKGFAGLICCKDAKNVTVRGGLLTSDDVSFFSKRDVDPDDYEPAAQAPAWYLYKVARERIAMVLCENSENVTFENVRIENYPGYAAWILSCTNVRVCGINTMGRKDLINTDGFHFSACKNVMVSSCVFECGDDCIAVDANHGGESHDVTVTNCIFNSSVHAVRVYTGIDEPKNEKMRTVRNVSISTCTVTDAAGVLDINADGGIIENVSMTNVNATLEAEGTSFLISAQNGEVHNVRISDFSVIGNGGGMIHTEELGSISRVRITDSEFVITPKTKLHNRFDLVPLAFPRHCHFFPSNFHFEKAKDVLVKDVAVTWTAPVYSDSFTPKRKAALEKRIAPLELSALEPKYMEAFKLIDCDGVRIEDTAAPDFDIENFK